MALASSVLIIPGWTNSGPQHWQSWLEKRHPEFTRVEQDDWDHPVREAWVVRLDEYVRRCARPPVLVAHSLGCQTVVHWAATHEQPIAGALLVAPPDLESDEAPLEEMGFHPVPLQPLSFPAILVASENDIYCAVERAREMAYAWGTRFVSAGECGHLNTAAGFGPWPYGEILLLGLLAAQG